MEVGRSRWFRRVYGGVKCEGVLEVVHKTGRRHLRNVRPLPSNDCLVYATAMAETSFDKHGLGAHSTPDDFQHLLAQARDGHEADSRLTLRQAVRQYKAPVAWAMFLSTSLIMEGYDLVMVYLLHELPP